MELAGLLEGVWEEDVLRSVRSQLCCASMAHTGKEESISVEDSMSGRASLRLVPWLLQEQRGPKRTNHDPRSITAKDS